MRINVYSQELTDEVIVGKKISNTGLEYDFAQLILHSSNKLHQPSRSAGPYAADDDRSAVTFWMPSSEHRCREMAVAFIEISEAFLNAADKRKKEHADG